jgi:hypothetical protein
MSYLDFKLFYTNEENYMLRLKESLLFCKISK